MTPALIDQNTVSVAAGPYLFSTTGSSIKFPGFMALYLSVADQKEKENEQKTGKLPKLAEGALLKLHKLDPKQHFTKPPPRFSEASLVKELEENGIGRPSTYTAILATIRQKGYVDLVKRYFRPSELGFLVNDILVGSFSDLFNVDFTADEGATIQGTVAGASRFGMLDAQPEAKLKAVLDISTSLAGTVDLQTMLPKILDTLFGLGRRRTTS